LPFSGQKDGNRPQSVLSASTRQGAIMALDENPGYNQDHRGGRRGIEQRTAAMKKLVVIVEKAKNNFSGYSPDLPGCVAAGKTREEVDRNMREAIALHLEGLREDNLPIPESTSYAEYIAIP
jgi:predicted RNase H-like HicB family nuclease